MIETVSYPANLGDWNAKSSNFYLELYGETAPLVDLSFAEFIPAGINTDDKQDPAAKTTASTPIYQYWWVIGQSGHEDALELRKHIQDPGGRVYMYFPLTAGWRVKELVATVKYLSPIKKDVDWVTKVAHIWDIGAPALGGASDIAKLIPPAAIPGSILAAISRIKLNDVPPVDDFAWTVGKVATNTQGNTLQGIMWTLPRKMFTDIGGRITGSLAVSFISSQPQQPGQVRAATDEPVFQQQPVRAHALIYADQRAKLPPDQGTAQTSLASDSSFEIFPVDQSADLPEQQSIYLPNHPSFIELNIQPRMS